ncbi:hypothetical protein GNZ12_24505 [Paraburkholderia sp. 1N]|uniref:Uncharacterized protein n=1 Tax=Paraburkholderia solitsugae TaxID=2675748 RepID=A0ABX2BUV0_9BURK|nr:hypothetical protein [Paraburkholderia solitsugae]
MAIETTLMLGSALRMRLRQTEGRLGSVVQLMGLTPPCAAARRGRPRSAIAIPMLSKPKQRSAWRCSTACWPPHARSPSALTFPQHSPWGKGHIAHTIASMHQRHAPAI